MQNFDLRPAINNVGAVVIGLAASVLVARAIAPTPVASCGDRYQTAMSFALERGGVLLTAADLQGHLAGRDLGLVQHVAIRHVEDAPAPVAMVVNLPKGGASIAGSAALAGVPQRDGGVSFPWEPHALQNTTSACLSYNLLLPASFEFAGGGALPGILIADHSEKNEGSTIARLVWRSSGDGGADQVTISGDERRAIALEPQAFPLSRGQWMKVDEETVLNVPGRRDGTLRLWIDGALVFERTDMELRSSVDMTISGVAASLFYGTEENMVRPPRDTTVMFSPFEIRWQQP